MSAPASPSSSMPNPLHAAFLTHVLPRVERHGKIYFRHVKCPDRKEELLAELRGLAWKWYVRLVRRGKDVLAFVSALASYAARAVNSGRRVCGHERKKDALSPVAQRLHGFYVESLPQATTASHERLYASPHGQERLDAFEERLRDNTQTPPDEQAAFRIDFPAWLTTLSHRDRDMVTDMALGERTLDLADNYGCSPGRISQKRRWFAEDWAQFCGDGEGI